MRSWPRCLPADKFFQLQLAASFRGQSQAEPLRVPVLSAVADPVSMKRCCAPAKRGAAADEPTVVPHPALIQLARLLGRQAARRADRRTADVASLQTLETSRTGTINCKARTSQGRAIDRNGPALLQMLDQARISSGGRRGGRSIFRHFTRLRPAARIAGCIWAQFPNRWKSGFI